VRHRVASPIIVSLMSWMVYCRTTLHPLNFARRQFSFSFRLRFPRDPSYLPNNAPLPLQTTGVRSFREQIARAIPVQSFADAVRHPAIGRHIIVCRISTALISSTALIKSICYSLCLVPRPSYMLSLLTTPILTQCSGRLTSPARSVGAMQLQLLAICNLRSRRSFSRSVPSRLFPSRTVCLSHSHVPSRRNARLSLQH
jgi:hypothetical protein